MDDDGMGGFRKRVEERNISLAQELVGECVSVFIGRALAKAEFDVIRSVRTVEILTELHDTIKSAATEDREAVLASAMDRMRHPG